MQESISIEKTVDRKTYMNNYMKEYRKLHIEKFTVRVKCDLCGCEYDKLNKTHHFRTRKHELNELRKQIESLKNNIQKI